MRGLPYVDIDYCRFSDWGYQKPTRFWGSECLGELPHVKCKGRSCKNVVRTENGFHHKERLGGNDMHFNTVQKGRIPSRVVDYLIREGEYAPSLVPKARLLGRRKGYKFDPDLRLYFYQHLGLERSRVILDVFASPKDAQEELFLTEQNSACFYNCFYNCG